MKNLNFIAAAAIIAAIATAPASARPHQPHWTPVRAEVIRDDIQDLVRDINRAEANKRISRREAANLRSRVRELRQEFQRFNRNGLTRVEVSRLQDRTNHIRLRLRMERVDWDRHPG